MVWNIPTMLGSGRETGLEPKGFIQIHMEGTSIEGVLYIQRLNILTNFVNLRINLLTPCNAIHPHPAWIVQAR